MPVHPNATAAWIEWEIAEGAPATVLVIETNLETRPNAPKFESGAFDDMVQSVAAAFAESGARSIRVVPKR